MQPINIRIATSKDLPSISLLFKNTVQSINIRDYNKTQIDAWCQRATPERWIELFESDLNFISAIDKQNEIIGFASISPTGYIHSMFVHHNHQREGIAWKMMNEIEKFAISRSIKILSSQVSITAKPFFLQKGFTVDKEQLVDINGVLLTNFSMKKLL